MTFWTDDRIAYLRAQAPHRSASLIAADMGCTRNAVIGKTHRLHITLGKPNDPEPPPPPPRPPVERRASPKLICAAPPPKPLPPAAINVCEPVAPKLIHELGERDCVWPLGDPLSAGFRYCAAPKSDHRYCASHAALSRGAGTPSERTAHKVKRSAYR